MLVMLPTTPLTAMVDGYATGVPGGPALLDRSAGAIAAAFENTVDDSGRFDADVRELTFDQTRPPPRQKQSKAAIENFFNWDSMRE
jgi:hypothetical protein